MARLWRVALFLGMCGSVAGCDDSPSDADADVDTDEDQDIDQDTDGEVDGDADADRDEDDDLDLDVEPVSLSVVVEVMDEWTGEPVVPAAGAAVVFDLPQGGRVDEVADEAGRVTIDGIEWLPDREAAVTAHVDGLTMVSLARLTQERVEQMTEGDGALHVRLWDDQREYVEVSGEAINMGDEDHYLVLGVAGFGLSRTVVGPEWSVEVEVGVPFTLTVLEWDSTNGDLVAWVIVEHEAVTEPTTIELDMADRAEPLTVEGSVAVPEHGLTSFFESAWAQVSVKPAWYNGMTGLQRGVMSLTPEADAWEYVAEYLELDGWPEPVTVYVLGTGNWETSSWVTVPGYPVGGDTEVDFPEPVRMTSPAGAEDHPISEPVTWAMNEVDASDSDLEVMLLVFRADDDEFVHEVFMPPGTTTVSIPAPPASVDPADLYGDLAIGRVRPCELDDERVWCVRLAVGLEFFLVQ